MIPINVTKSPVKMTKINGTNVPLSRFLAKDKTLFFLPSATNFSVFEKQTIIPVNDLSKSADYAEYYNWIAPQLKSKGCELYFMSVNPVNRLMLSNTGRGDRSEAAVRSFNEYMKSNLSSDYTYIDMYSYLKSTGYSFASDKYGSGTIDDGLHYTAKTYKRIYAKCMDSLRVPA